MHGECYVLRVDAATLVMLWRREQNGNTKASQVPRVQGGEKQELLSDSSIGKIWTYILHSTKLINVYSVWLWVKGEY